MALNPQKFETLQIKHNKQRAQNILSQNATHSVQTIKTNNHAMF